MNEMWRCAKGTCVYAKVNDKVISNRINKLLVKLEEDFNEQSEICFGSRIKWC